MCSDMENNYLQENIIISHGERLNSPFYPLIAVLKKYGRQQATTHDLANVLDRTLSTITLLLEKLEEDTGDPEQKLVMIDILETLGGIILELIRSVYLDERVDNVGEFIDLISSYDLRFIDVRKKAAVENMEEQTSDDNLICSIFETLPDREKFNAFFEELKELTDKYAAGTIDERKFLDRTGFIKDYIIETGEEFENKYVNAGEWGKEASSGDNLLLEGLSDWEKSIKYFLDIFSTEFREQFSKGLSLAEEANKKMSMVSLGRID